MRYKSEIQLDEAQIKEILRQHFASKGHNVESASLRVESRQDNYGETATYYTTGKVTVFIEDSK